MKAFIAGWPISHALSPVLHGFWLKELAIAGTYESVAVQPANFAAFIAGIAADGWAGGNVTIPHKEAALACAGRPDSTATAVGAANTLWLEDGSVCATNTDSYGFAAGMDQDCPGWEGNGSAIVLGAGGAARAVIHALKLRGFGDIAIVNRTPGRARDLARHFGGPCRASSRDSLAGLIPSAGLIVNTTSLGMAGQPMLDIDLGAASGNLVVSDIVYSPLITPFVAAARKQGLRAVDGLGMLLHQAAPGFERWFGVRPKVGQALRDAMIRELDRRSAGK